MPGARPGPSAGAPGGNLAFERRVAFGAGGCRGNKRPLRVLAAGELVFFPDEAGFFVHPAVGPHRFSALGAFVFAKQPGTDPPLSFQPASPACRAVAALLGVCHEAAGHEQESGNTKTKKGDHNQGAEKG